MSEIGLALDAGPGAQVYGRETQKGSRTIPGTPDRRPERTRKALLNAFIALILERGYEAVSVDDVVQRADIGRSTLYAHFGGLEGMLKQSLTFPSTPLAALADQSVTPEALIAQMTHFKEQRKRNKVFFAPPLRGLWVRRLAELIEPRLTAWAEAEGRTEPAVSWRFAALQVAEGQIALIANWLALAPNTSAEVMAEALAATTRAVIDGLAPAG